MSEVLNLSLYRSDSSLYIKKWHMDCSYTTLLLTYQSTLYCMSAASFHTHSWTDGCRGCDAKGKSAHLDIKHNIENMVEMFQWPDADTHSPEVMFNVSFFKHCNKVCSSAAAIRTVLRPHRYPQTILLLSEAAKLRAMSMITLVIKALHFKRPDVYTGSDMAEGIKSR